MPMVNSYTSLERERSSRPREQLRTGQLLSLPLLAFFVVPLLVIFLRVDPAQLLSNLGSEQVAQAIGLSARTTLVTTGLTILLGIPVAQILARRRSRAWSIVDTLIDLPTVLPPSVAGIALLITFGRRGLVGEALTQLGVQIAFTEIAVVLAQTFVAAPFFVKAAALGFAGVNAEIREAAAIDGASRWQVFRFVIVPLSWSALVSGSVMTWARALGEFGATIIFAGNYPGRTQMMPLAIYIGFEIDLDVALTLSVILISLSFAALLVVKSFVHRNGDVEDRRS